MSTPRRPAAVLLRSAALAFLAVPALAAAQDTAPPSERTTIEVPREKLDRLAGTYELGPGMELVVTLENGQLMSQATGQAKAALFAEAEDQFFLKVANAQIEFVREGERVTALVLHQGGRETRAARK